MSLFFIQRPEAAAASREKGPAAWVALNWEAQRRLARDGRQSARFLETLPALLREKGPRP